MAAVFQQPVGFDNLVEGKDLVDDGRDGAGGEQRPNLGEKIVADGAFSSAVRGRMVEPVTVRRLTMIGERLTFSAIAPPRKAMIDRQPSLASEAMLRSK